MWGNFCDILFCTIYSKQQLIWLKIYWQCGKKRSKIKITRIMWEGKISNGKGNYFIPYVSQQMQLTFFLNSTSPNPIRHIGPSPSGPLLAIKIKINYELLCNSQLITFISFDGYMCMATLPDCRLFTKRSLSHKLTQRCFVS